MTRLRSGTRALPHAGARGYPIQPLSEPHPDRWSPASGMRHRYSGTRGKLNAVASGSLTAELPMQG